MAGQKVLIFEQDRVFAEALRREFVARNCIVRTVDDGQAGLELALTDPPDLIILSIELPRMNGFAVCNRIKKSPELKDVPLLIVSADAPPETFEQHSKLRTRAEDYAHKPIAPEVLADRAATFLPLDPPSRDSVELAADDILLVDDAVIVESPASIPPPSPDDLGLQGVDSELEGLTDAAFSSIMVSPDPQLFRTATQPSLRPPAFTDFEDFTTVAPRIELPPALAAAPGPRMGSVPPRLPTSPAMPAVNLVAEVDRMRRRADELDRELLEARRAAQQVEAAQEAEIGRLRAQAEEAAALRRELDELRHRASRPTPGPTGGVSTREFLELREGLNRKDKEILQLREAVNNRDKELLELRDRMLQSDLSRADIDDKLLEHEQAMESLQDQLRAAQGQITTLETARDEARQHLDALQADLTAKSSAVDALQADLAGKTAELAALHDDLDARGASLLALQGELDTARAQAEHAQAEALQRLEAASEAHALALQAQAEAHAKALHEAAERAEEEIARLKAAHEVVEAEATSARLRAAEIHAAEVRALQEAEGRLREAHAVELSALQETAAKLREAHAAEVSMLVEAHAADSEQLRAEAQRQRDAHAAAVAAAVAATASVEEARAQEAAERARAAAEHAQALQAADEARAALQGSLDEALRELFAARESSQHEAEALREALRGATDRAERAHRKSARDGDLLDRARRALEIAAALVEETQHDDPPAPSPDDAPSPVDTA